MEPVTVEPAGGGRLRLTFQKELPPGYARLRERLGGGDDLVVGREELVAALRSLNPPRAAGPSLCGKYLLAQFVFVLLVVVVVKAVERGAQVAGAYLK